MTQFYFDPTRESLAGALPDGETFCVQPATAKEWNLEPGWYWWACFPGCLPDGVPDGPFGTEAEAIADAQRGSK